MLTVPKPQALDASTAAGRECAALPSASSSSGNGSSNNNSSVAFCSLPGVP